MLARQRQILILLIPLIVLAIGLLGLLSVQTTSAEATDLRLAEGVYLPAAQATWLALIAFGPLFVALAFAWQTERPVVEYFQPELVGTFAVWISLANGYVVLYVLRLLGELPGLDPLPTALTDTRLINLPLYPWAIAAALGTAFFFGWFLFGRHFGFGAIADRIELPHRRVVLLFMLALLAVAVWLFGGLSYSLVLIAPACLWIFIEPTTQPRTKIINGALAVSGGLTLLLPIFFLPAGVGLWQVIAAVAYLTIWPLDVLLYFLALALFLRFLRLGFSKPYVAPPVPEDPLLALLKNDS